MLYRRFLEFADNSLNVAKLVSTKPDLLFGTALFYTRQCAEYSLKAYLGYHEIRTERVKKLSEYIKMCTKFDKTFKELSETVDKLDPYTEELTRYPTDEIIPKDVSNEQGLAYAAEVLQFIREKIKLHDTSELPKQDLQT